jgi:hypothetical protein
MELKLFVVRINNLRMAYKRERHFFVLMRIPVWDMGDSPMA